MMRNRLIAFIYGFFPVLVCSCFISCHSSSKKNASVDSIGTKSMDSARNLNVTKFNGNPMKQQSAQYLMKVYSNSLYDIRSSKMAERHSSNKEIQDLAAFLVNAHTKLNDEIENMAARAQISLPGNLSREQQAALDRLNRKKGSRYAENYLREMVNNHKSTLNVLKKAGGSSDALIHSWSERTLPKIERYLDKITTCQKRIDSLFNRG